MPMLKQADYDELIRLAERGKEAEKAPIQTEPVALSPQNTTATAKNEWPTTYPGQEARLTYANPEDLAKRASMPPKRVEIAVKDDLKKRPTAVTLTSTPEYPLFDNEGRPVQYRVLFEASAVEKLNANLIGDKSVIENATNDAAFYKGKGPSIALYSIKNVQDIENEVIRKGNERLKAGGYLQTLDTPIKRADFARIMGVNTDMVSETTIFSKLIELSEKAPDAIIKEWEKPDRKERTILSRAVERKIVSVRNQIYYYGDEIMGENFEKALIWMKNNPDIASIIEYNSEVI